MVTTSDCNICSRKDICSETRKVYTQFCDRIDNTYKNSVLSGTVPVTINCTCDFYLKATEVER